MAELGHSTLTMVPQGLWTMVVFPHLCCDLVRPCVHPQAGGGQAWSPWFLRMLQPLWAPHVEKMHSPSSPWRVQSLRTAHAHEFLAYLSVLTAESLGRQCLYLAAPCLPVPAPCCPCLLSAHCCPLLAHPWPFLPVVVFFLSPVPVPCPSSPAYPCLSLPAAPCVSLLIPVCSLLTVATSLPICTSSLPAAARACSPPVIACSLPDPPCLSLPAPRPLGPATCPSLPAPCPSLPAGPCPIPARALTPAGHQRHRQSHPSRQPRRRVLRGPACRSAPG